MAEEITEETVEQLKAADARVRAIDLAAGIEGELQQSRALRLVISRAHKHAGDCLEALANVTPTDTNEIIKLQAGVYRARFIEETLAAVMDAGRKAEQDIRSEDAEAEDGGQ